MYIRLIVEFISIKLQQARYTWQHSCKYYNI